jgi:Phospholipase_D-nuclease N-terminal
VLQAERPEANHSANQRVVVSLLERPLGHLIVFAWVLFIWIAIVVFIDLFGRRDISGWRKAAWVVLIVILPWIGVLAYLIVNHDGMAERKEKQSRAAQAQFDEYVRQAAGKGGPASEIETAKQLLESGTITQPEFDAIKAKALGSPLHRASCQS